MENIGNKNAEKNELKFECKKCLYKTCRKYDFDRHCLSPKHQNNANGNVHAQNKLSSCVCKNCNRSFQTVSGLWKHEQKCPNPKNEKCVLVEYLMQENKDLKQTIIQRDDEFRKLIIEVCKNTAAAVVPPPNHVTNNNTMINSNNINKTFNLHFFLNETCKDALNLSEFIQTIKVGIDDLNSMGSLGYVDGTSNVIIKHLNELGVEKRPIQCTDAKRQTLYIKENNEWTKEEPSCAKLQGLVDEVQQINLRALPAWREKHPNCLKSNSIHTDFYNNMSQELMGGFCHKVKLHVKDNKIINKIIKEVVIDKQKFVNM